MLLLIGPVVFKIISVGQQLFALKKKSPQEAAGEVAGLKSKAQSSRIAKAAEGRAAWVAHIKQQKFPLPVVFFYKVGLI